MWFSCLLIAASSLLGAGLMLVLRRVLKGGYVHDSDRLSSIFGFVGTAFAVFLAFVIFLATETYTGAKAHAGHEADALFDQYEVAGRLPSADRERIRSQLVCYGRAVVNDEWRLMRSHTQSKLVDDWTIALEASLTNVQAADMKSEDAVTRLLEESTVRDEGRRGRLQEADGSVPAPMWLMLILSSVCVVGYVFLYADLDERAFVQSAQIGVVVAMVVTSLLLIDFLDHPYRNATASIQPDPMRHSLQLMDRDGAQSLRFPCDAGGR